MIGKTVSHFRVLEKIGEGGMGVVYKAEDTRLHRTVALKFISRQMLGSDEVIARFIREAQAAAACEHPNVCTIYEVDDSDHGAFIAMAYVEGLSLKDRIASGAVPLDEALDVAIQVGRGLEAAHRRGVIHRDIKPGNIMMTPHGLAKIMDFGLARPPEVTQLTRAGSTVGTIAYMSPEQTRGREVDGRSDIWALGVVLYEMVSGERPFRGDYEQAVVYSILNEEPDPMADQRRVVPAELERIVSRALAKSPAERYQRVEQMLAELCALKGGPADLATRLLVPVGPDSARTNLPFQVTSFVGRDEAVIEVRRLLNENRLLTLTGAGGCGKTRLAQEVGSSLLEDFTDGVWLVELAPARDPALVPQTVAAALGLMEASSLTPTEALVDHLRRRSLLLVLDNCEHLLAACAELADRLLRSCSDVHLLATSREPLAIAGETIFRVPSLAVPNAEGRHSLGELAETGAVRLFVERATAAETGFALTNENAPAIAEISRRLDGIPLALELAAARIKVLPATEIAKRLEDRFELLSSGARASPPRHQTLRALVDWSYEQLSEHEQMLLGRLSMFAGGWTLDSAEAVCTGEGIKDSDVLELMSSLVEKSLVEKLTRLETSGLRYRMHETIREYARDHLSEEGTALWARRHRDHFLELAEEAEPHLRGGDEQTAWLSRLGAEDANLRAAFGTCMEEDGGALVGLRLAGALGQFWVTCGHWSEGRRTCAELLARPEARGEAAGRARLLRLAGGLAGSQSDYAEARGLLEESLAISRELEDRRGLAESLLNLGVVTWREDDHAGARSLYEESLKIARELGDEQLVSGCLNSLANIEGDPGTKRELYLKSLELTRRLRDRRGEARVLGSLGWLAVNEGDYGRALSVIEESLSIYRELDDSWGVAWTLLLRAGVATDLGDLERAREFSEESLLLTRKLGARTWESYAVSILGRAVRLQGNLERARALLEENLPTAAETGRTSEANAFLDLGLVSLEAGEHDRARELLADSLRLHWDYGTRRGVAAGLEGLGILAVATGANERAARLFGAADALREEKNCPVPPVDKPRVESGISAAHRELGEPAFEEHWGSGRAMTGEEAIEYARRGDRGSSPAEGGSGQAR